MLLIALASVIAAANLFTTVLKLRAPGMTMPRVPAFSWSVLVVSAGILLATPVFVAGLCCSTSTSTSAPGSWRPPRSTAISSGSTSSGSTAAPTSTW